MERLGVIPIYDKIAILYAKKFSEASGHIDEFLSLIPKGGKILDVGCGVGVDSNHINSKGFKIIGIDLSKEMLKIVRKKFPGIEFKQQDIRNINFPKKYFDGILASFSLIHIPKSNFSMVLRKFHDLLKEKGIIYLGLQEGKSKETIVNEPFRSNEKIFLNVISFDEIKGLLIENGFKIIKKYRRSPKLKGEFNFTKLFIIAKKE